MRMALVRPAWAQRSLLVLLIRAGFLLSSASANPEPASGEESEAPVEVTRFEKATACMVIISVLMIVSISWEHLQDFLDESSGEHFRPVLSSLFEELTLTGFLGLSMTAIQNTGIMEDLSLYFFREEEVVEELYEKIHLTIFGVTVSYLTIVVGIMFMAKRERLRMLHAEAACVEDPETVIKNYYRWKGDTIRDRKCWTPWPVYPTCDAQYDYHWLVMRQQFFKAVNRNNVKMQVTPETFDMAEYLSLYMIMALEKIISIGMRTWLCVWILCVLFYGMFLSIDPDLFAWVVLGFGWLALGFSFWLGSHFQWVSQQLMPRDIVEQLIIREELGKFKDEKTELSIDLQREYKTTRNRSVNPKNIDEAVQAIIQGDLDDPVYRQIDLANEEQEKVCCGCFKSCCDTDVANPHQKLFMFTHKGTQFYMFMIRFNVLITAIYISSFVFIWMRNIFCPSGATQCYTSILAVFLLPFTLVCYYRHLIRCFTFVTAVEEEVSRKLCQEAIAEVVRTCKTKQCIRIVQLLTIMAQRQAKNNKDIIAYLSHLKEKNSSMQDRKGSTAEQIYADKHTLLEKRRHYRKIFKMFDTDSSGSLEYEEMFSMLKLLGILDEDDKGAANECKIIMDDIDDDGNGSITFEEFFDWVAMSDMVMRHEHFRHTLIKQIFDKLDIDNSGSIDADELKAMLSKFDDKVTNNDITTIMKEVGRGKTEIDFEDFHEFVEKYMAY